MGKVIAFLSFILMIFLLMYFFAPSLLPRLTKDLDQVPTKDDQVKVVITRPSDIPDDMEIKNKSKIKVKVYVYNCNDPVRMIARKEWVLNTGESATYPLDNYRFKVVKPLAESGIIGSRKVEITGDEKHIEILGKPKKPVTFTNKTNENFKISAFDPDDQAQMTPFKSWNIVAGQKIEWDNAPRWFSIRVFRAKVLDKALSAWSNVRDQSDIVIRSRGIWDWIKDPFHDT